MVARHLSEMGKKNVESIFFNIVVDIDVPVASSGVTRPVYPALGIDEKKHAQPTYYARLRW